MSSGPLLVFFCDGEAWNPIQLVSDPVCQPPPGQEAAECGLLSISVLAVCQLQEQFPLTGIQRFLQFYL